MKTARGGRHWSYLHGSPAGTGLFVPPLRRFSYKSDRIPTSEAIFYSSLDTITALSLALFVNAAILIVAAAAFFDPSGSTQDAPSVSEAYDLLAPVLGKKVPELGEGYIF